MNQKIKIKNKKKIEFNNNIKKQMKKFKNKIFKKNKLRYIKFLIINKQILQI